MPDIPPPPTSDDQNEQPEHIEPPLLESPVVLDNPTTKPDASDKTAVKNAGDSDVDLSDLISSMSEDGSSAFEFDLDEDEP